MKKTTIIRAITILIAVHAVGSVGCSNRAVCTNCLDERSFLVVEKDPFTSQHPPSFSLNVEGDQIIWVELVKFRLLSGRATSIDPPPECEVFYEETYLIALKCDLVLVPGDDYLFEMPFPGGDWTRIELDLIRSVDGEGNLVPNNIGTERPFWNQPYNE